MDHAILHGSLGAKVIMQITCNVAQQFIECNKEMVPLFICSLGHTEPMAGDSSTEMLVCTCARTRTLVNQHTPTTSQSIYKIAPQTHTHTYTHTHAQPTTTKQFEKSAFGKGAKATASGQRRRATRRQGKEHNPNVEG